MEIVEHALHILGRELGQRDTSYAGSAARRTGQHICPSRHLSERQHSNGWERLLEKRRGA
jgi:hypothetical protein